MIDDMIEDTDSIDILYKCREGQYDTKLPYPHKPRKPGLLNKIADKLTETEILELCEIKSAHEQACMKYRGDLVDYHRDETRLKEQFRADLEAYFETKGKPKADLLWSKAWEAGHSGGYEEVYCHYADLHELIV